MATKKRKATRKREPRHPRSRLTKQPRRGGVLVQHKKKIAMPPPITEASSLKDITETMETLRVAEEVLVEKLEKIRAEQKKLSELCSRKAAETDAF